MTPLDESKIVATRTLDGVTPSGERTRVVITIGTPYAQGNGFRCPVRIEGLDYDYTPPDMAGWDAVHALVAAITIAASLTDDFVVRGGRVFWPGTETPYDFADFTIDFRAPKQT
jgi:hypothetical protein